MLRFFLPLNLKGINRTSEVRRNGEDKVQAVRIFIRTNK